MKISAQYVHTQSIVYSGLLTKTTSTTTCSLSEAIHNIFIVYIFTKCKVHTSICSMFCTASEAPQYLLRLLVIAASYILPILFIRSCQYFYQAVCAKFSSDLLNSFDQMLSMACNAVQFFCYLKFMPFDIIKFY